MRVFHCRTLRRRSARTETNRRIRDIFHFAPTLVRRKGRFCQKSEGSVPQQPLGIRLRESSQRHDRNCRGCGFFLQCFQSFLPTIFGSIMSSRIRSGNFCAATARLHPHRRETHLIARTGQCPSRR